MEALALFVPERAAASPRDRRQISVRARRSASSPARKTVTRHIQLGRRSRRPVQPCRVACMPAGCALPFAPRHDMGRPGCPPPAPRRGKPRQGATVFTPTASASEVARLRQGDFLARAARRRPSRQVNQPSVPSGRLRSGALLSRGLHCLWPQGSISPISDRPKVDDEVSRDPSADGVIVGEPVADRSQVRAVNA
jgi:hypothetical protein